MGNELDFSFSTPTPHENEKADDLTFGDTFLRDMGPREPHPLLQSPLKVVNTRGRCRYTKTMTLESSHDTHNYVIAHTTRDAAGVRTRNKTYKISKESASVIAENLRRLAEAV